MHSGRPSSCAFGTDTIASHLGRLIALANAVGLIAALVGNGGYDLISRITLGLTLLVIVHTGLGWRERDVGLDRDGLM